MERLEAIRLLSILYRHDLKFCGCGMPEEVMLLIKDILEVYEHEVIRNVCYEIESDPLNDIYKKLIDICNLKDDSSRSRATIETILGFLVNVQLLDHGVTAINCWLTDFGRLMLQAFRVVPDIEAVFRHNFSKDF